MNVDIRTFLNNEYHNNNLYAGNIFWMEIYNTQKISSSIILLLLYMELRGKEYKS